MFAIHLSTGFTWAETQEVFKRLPGSPEFWYTDGPATNILVRLPGADREIYERWVTHFKPTLSGYFAKFNIIADDVK